jgi:hypothetical protein
MTRRAALRLTARLAAEHPPGAAELSRAGEMTRDQREPSGCAAGRPITVLHRDDLGLPGRYGVRSADSNTVDHHPSCGGLRRSQHRRWLHRRHRELAQLAGLATARGPPGRFPLVHADSLAEGVASALHYEGPFILSDEMCDLPTLAHTLRRDARSYVPPTVPASLAYAAAKPIEALARALHRHPILSRVQLDFISSGAEPLADRARETFGFSPLPIEEGLSRYLANRTTPGPRP